MNVYKHTSFSSEEMTTLPGWLTNSKLSAGGIASASVYNTKPAAFKFSEKVTSEFCCFIYDYFEGHSVAGKNGDVYVAETETNGHSYAIMANKNAFRVSCDGNSIKKGNDLPERLGFLLMLPALMENNEFYAELDRLAKETDDDNRTAIVATLYDNVYMRKNEEPLKTIADVLMKQQLSLTAAAAGKEEAKPKEQYSMKGKRFSFFQNSIASFAGKTTAEINIVNVEKGSAVNGKYQLVPRDTMTPEQIDNIIELDDTMILNPDAEEACQMIYKTKDFISPVRNVLFTGLPGVGKTEAAKQIAAMLGVPFYFTQLYDLFTGEDAKGTFQPNVSDEGRNDLSAFLSKMPTAEDIILDPAEAYKAVTGIEKEDASPDEVDDAIKAATAEFVADMKTSQGAIRFVPGVVEHACEPCVIFIDEITAPKNPAAVTVFNSLMDRSSRIVLTNNKVVRRHRNCIIIAAGNFSDDGIEMEGFRDPNRSFLDRFDEVINLQAPSAELIKAMLLANNEYDENKDGAEVPIDAFVIAMPQLKEICLGYGDSCEFRAINAWFRKSLITRDPISAADKTVIGISTRQESCKAAMKAKIATIFK